jgi:poly(A) polymerase
VEDLTAHHIANGEPPLPARQQAIQEAISVQGQRTSIPKRFQFTMRDIWEMQSRLPHRHGNRALRLLEHPKFRAAYDFLLLREEAGAETGQLGSWWENFQFANEHKQQQMLAELGAPQTKRRRRRAPRPHS